MWTPTLVGFTPWTSLPFQAWWVFIFILIQNDECVFFLFLFLNLKCWISFCLLPRTPSSGSGTSQWLRRATLWRYRVKGHHTRKKTKQHIFWESFHFLGGAFAQRVCDGHADLWRQVLWWRWLCLCCDRLRLEWDYPLHPDVDYQLGEVERMNVHLIVLLGSGDPKRELVSWWSLNFQK